MREITDENAAHSLRQGWTRKEELGHLIDSATNNHARFVNITREDHYHCQSYNPDEWVRLQGYAHLPWETIVNVWYGYNSLLAELVRRIPEDRLIAPCEVASGGQMTLRLLIEDYVVHLQHHVDQLMGREVITHYPQMSAVVQR